MRLVYECDSLVIDVLSMKVASIVRVQETVNHLRQTKYHENNHNHNATLNWNSLSTMYVIIDKGRGNTGGLPNNALLGAL